MNRRKHKSEGGGRKIGSLGEALLNAGLSPVDLSAAANSSASLRRDRQRQLSSEKVAEPGEAKPKSQKAKKGKSKKRKQKLKNRKKFLRPLERQMARKNLGAVVVPSIMGDVVHKPEAKPVEDEYSVRRVQQTLKAIARQIQEMSPPLVGRPTGNGSSEIAQRLVDFQNIRDLVTDINTSDRELVLGFDFGSTSSKLVLRFPYEEGLGAYAVPAPKDLCSEDHPYYWKTQLWERTDSCFELQGSQDATLFNHLKVAFLNALGDECSEKTLEDVHVCAYLALMIRQSLGWLWQTLGTALRSKSLSVSVNFGFPTEGGGSSPEQVRFHKCGEAALDLALSDAQICSREVMHALSQDLSSSSQILVVPEFIGAVMGYFHSAQRRNGQFMICDFGGLTIDAVCFGFFQKDDGGSLVKIYGSSVEPFGSEVAKLAVKQGTPQRKLKTAIGSFICDPVRDAYKKTGCNAPAWGGQTPLFVIGGGRHCREYDKVFHEAECLMKNGVFNTKFRQQDLDLDEELGVPLAKGRNCGRLLVALGLSHSDLDLPEWLTRGEIADAPKMKKRRVGDLFVGKEQT